jgi:hypothetical protein
MNAWPRIAIMVVVSEVVLMIISAGFDIQGMMFVGGFILVIGTLPLIGIIAIFHVMQKRLGNIVIYLIAMIGFIPTFFVFVVAPAMGVVGGFNAYAQSLCVAGWIWSAAWILTSQVGK